MLGSETKTIRTVIRVLVVTVSLALGAASGSANSIDWTLALDKLSQTGPAGSTLVFSGTITNSTGADLFLDTAFIDFTANGPFAKDYDDNFLSLLGIIPPGGYSGPLFFIQWLPGAVPGDSGTGTFELTAVAPISPSVASVDFSAAVSTVPEPTTFVLITLPLVLLFIRGPRSFRSKNRERAPF
jgi:hypothetical protein